MVDELGVRIRGRPSRRCLAYWSAGLALIMTVVQIHASDFPELTLEPPIALAQVQTPSPPPFADYQHWLHQTLEQASIPGAAYAIVQQGRVVLIDTYGVRELGQQSAVDQDTLFRIASVSKTFASALAIKLESQGRFTMTDPLLDHLPDLQFADPVRAGSVTLGHLIGQRSGIVPHAYDNLLNHGETLSRILPKFSELDFLCAPGDCYSYQNVLFGLIAPISESVTSTGYDQLLAETFFAPLEMTTASVGLQAYMDAGNRAAAHVRKGSEWATTEVTGNYYIIPAAAGVNASITDMSRWLLAQMGASPEVLSDEELQKLTTPGVRTTRELYRRDWRELLSDAHYGLGWRLYTIGGQTLVYHGGWVKGFRSHIAYSPDHQTGLVLLINAESRVMSELTSRFWSTVFHPEP